MHREDLFTLIHKGLRGILYGLGLRLQRNDFSEELPTMDLLTFMRSTLDLMNVHATHEENHIFPQLRGFERDLVAALELDHGEIERMGSALEAAAKKIEEENDPGALIDLGDALLREYNAYLAL